MDATWKEYNFKDIGYEIRYEKGLDMLRNLIASMFNSSGFAKRTIRPGEVMELPYVDVDRSIEEVRRVPKEFIERALNILRHAN
jgi:hypothetical protein